LKIIPFLGGLCTKPEGILKEKNAWKAYDLSATTILITTTTILLQEE